MASTIKVTNINTPDGSGSITVDRPLINTGDFTVTSGDLVFSTAGKGVCLGVTSNTDANTLEDYEEGTWTPVIAALSTQSPSDQSYSTQTGIYTKIGRQVHVSCRVDLSDKGTLSGFLILNGLPFTVGSSNGNRGTGSCPQWGATATNLVFCSVYASESTTFGYIRGAGSATGTLAGLSTSDLNDTSWFYMSMSYMV